MPSTSPAQHAFMLAVEHSPQFAHKVGVPQKVGRDFAHADQAEGKYQKRGSDGEK